MQAFPMRDRQGGHVWICGTFTINGTSDPDGIRGDPGFTVTRLAAARFQVTLSNDRPYFSQYDFLAAFYSSGGPERAAGDQAPVAYVTAYSVDDATFNIETYTIDSSGQLVASEVDNSEVTFLAVIRQDNSPQAL